MTRTEFNTLLNSRILFLDGAVGTFLIDAGLKPGQAPEEFNIGAPDAVFRAHRGYIEAGADIILTNTFGGSSIKLAEFGIEDKTAEINIKGAEIARKAVAGTSVLIAGSIGPSGKYLPPIGSLDFDSAVNTFRQQAQSLMDGGVDLMVVETMSDIREMRACLIGIREVYNGPIIAHMTYSDGFNTITGTGPETAAVIIEALDVDAIGVNCSTGPREMLPIVETLVKSTHLPVSVEPNAGMPRVISGVASYPEPPEVLAEYAVKFADAGVNIIGACCGSGPEHIRAMKEALQGHKLIKRNTPRKSRLCSRDRTVTIGDDLPVTILGERINPTGRKKFAQSLAGGNMNPVRAEADSQVKEGAAVLDVNMGVPGEDEPELMRKAVRTVQSVVNVPLCLDSADVDALEAGLKEIEGKPLVNSVTAEREKLDTVIPLVKKYGAALIGLPLDDHGIPETAEGRFKLGKLIVNEALKGGIPREDIYLDGLTMTLSADVHAPRITLETIRRFKQELGVRTILGVSNVSFGLPRRAEVNAAFLTMALQEGLDLPIVNPYSKAVKNAVSTADLLLGRDPGAKCYLEFARGIDSPSAKSKGGENELSPAEKLSYAVITGNREETGTLVEQLLKDGVEAIKINDVILIPAILEVGERYDRKEFYLPQVIMAAEAMHAAFATLKPHLLAAGSVSKGTVVLATVKGDVHDIGKNIVATLVENNGYDVIDLGKNIGTNQVIAAIREHSADIVGLSALMTTTMVVMEQMVKEIKAEIETRIIVGGAVVTRQFADEIGADGYAKDAAGAVREIRKIIS